MSYDEKVARLSNLIQRAVKFDSLHQAEEMRDAWRESVDSEAYKRLQGLAESLLLWADDPNLNIDDELRLIAGSDRTRLSALREAIRLCAKAYLERHQARVDSETGCDRSVEQLMATT